MLLSLMALILWTCSSNAKAAYVLGKASDVEACLNLKDVEEATLKPDLPSKIDLGDFGMTPPITQTEQAEGQPTNPTGKKFGRRFCCGCCSC